MTPPASPFQLAGSVAVVTGGATGLGLEIADCLLQAGARPVIVSRRQEQLDAASERLGTGVAAVKWDITHLEGLPDLVSRIEEDVGPVDILVNNAGNHLKRPATEVSDEEFQDVIGVHVFASFALTREIGGRMVSRGAGSVVFISSMNSIIGMPEVVAYSAAKASVTGMVRALAVEWASSDVRVNGVVPGWIDAGMAKRVLGANPARKERVLARTPLGRMGAGSDVGWAVVYLCSPAGGFVTGTLLNVDGGAAIGF